MRVFPSVVLEDSVCVVAKEPAELPFVELACGYYTLKPVAVVQKVPTCPACRQALDLGQVPAKRQPRALEDLDSLRQEAPAYPVRRARALE